MTRGELGTLRLGMSAAARHGIRPRLVSLMRERHLDLRLDVSEATSGPLCRDLALRRLDAAVVFGVGPTPGLKRRLLGTERLCVVMRAGHRLAGAGQVRLEDLRGDRFVVPGEDQNVGFTARLRSLCREHGFEPVTTIASVVWDDAEWPPGDDVVSLAPARWTWDEASGVRTVALVPEECAPLELAWREDDDSPRLRALLETAAEL